MGIKGRMNEYLLQESGYRIVRENEFGYILLEDQVVHHIESPILSIILLFLSFALLGLTI